MADDDEIRGPAFGVADDLFSGVADPNVEMDREVVPLLDRCLERLEQLVAVLFSLLDDGFGLDLAAEVGRTGDRKHVNLRFVLSVKVKAERESLVRRVRPIVGDQNAFQASSPFDNRCFGK